ncbi:hypothetical protein FHR80_000270 [Cellulomonas cellasea]|uniref:Uncharacterized protein n=1 Tax=Cellulomonas cellasea TaxID=43670 RepID=A0A7W4UBX3_9CELL|nr:hypothetical protein [Cellulomonas cellasea]
MLTHASRLSLVHTDCSGHGRRRAPRPRIPGSPHVLRLRHRRRHGGTRGVALGEDRGRGDPARPIGPRAEVDGIDPEHG